MDLINNTSYPAQMFRTGLGEEKYAASVCLRVTYNIQGDQLVISPTHQWELSHQQWQTEVGILESDFVFKRGGVDILIFGKAIAPQKMPVSRMEVEVDIKNKLNHKLLIFGNRKWEKSILGIEISKPEPFTELPLALENAFGGKYEWDGLQIPHGNNPYGKGYYFSKEAAIGGPLPNIENPKNPIRKWNDNIDPVGFCCLPQCVMHMAGNIEHDNNGRITKLGARVFNTAFPSMIANEIVEGDQFHITGMSLKPITFLIPPNHFILKVINGEKMKEWKMYIEQVAVVVEKQEVFITYRYPFNYVLEPMQKRYCEIIE
jgi:hypothetical protein